MTADELQALDARYKRASARTEALREERNAAVRALLASGWTHAQVAMALGVSRGRVAQLAKPPGTAPTDCPRPHAAARS